MSVFTRQFTPVDGGYLYYPSRKGGGKLVTYAEFEILVSGWQRVAGRRGRWKSVGLIAVAVLVWTLISQALALPERADWIVVVAMVVGLSGWLLWASFAPRRLVKDRSAIAPPRSLVQAGREARAAISWPLVIFVLLLSAVIFLGHLSSPDDSVAWWAWSLGSGLMLAGYLRIALQKLRDR